MNPRVPGDTTAAPRGEHDTDREGRGAAMRASVVTRWRDEITSVRGTGSSSADVDLMAALEELKSAACAAQARLAVEVDAAERDRQAVAGVPVRRRGTGVAAQIGLARRESPHRATVLLGAAKVWTREMPCTLEALTAGRLSEHRALVLVAETACLELEDRQEVDRLLCADPEALEGIGTRQLAAMTRAHAARLDPAAVARRARRAESERCVTIRPAPDTMCYVTALLPMKTGVAVFAALKAAADLARSTAGGDPRGHGQLMAATFVERITGHSDLDAIPVTVNLVMSDASLLGAGHEAASIDGGAAVPAQVAREIVAGGLDAEAAWLRRLCADPGGRLVAMTSRERFFPSGLASFLQIRDQGICRTPYCDAPIRHVDHIVPAARGGETDESNGQGLCEACNHAKQAPGWSQSVVSGALARGGPATGPHTVQTTTPTGHRYTSRAPAPPRPARSAVRTHGDADDRRTVPGAVVDMMFADLVASHLRVEHASRAA